MRKILITGADGFIGGALIRHFAKKDFFIYAFVQDEQKLNDLSDRENIEIIKCEMENYINADKLIGEQLDAAYHFAWAGTFGQKLTNYGMQLSNVKNSCDLLTSLGNIGCKHFIFIGTINELEIKNSIIYEEKRLRKAGIYANSKLACEMYLRILANEMKIKYNTAMLSSVYGPGDYSYMIQNVLIKKFLEGESPKLVEGEGLYDWLYIDDAVQMLAKIANSKNDFKTYYIGNKKLRKFKDIVTEVRDIVNPKVRLEFGTIKGDAKIDYSLIDTGLLHEEFDISKPTDFKQSIKNTVKWIKEQNI